MGGDEEPVSWSVRARSSQLIEPIRDFRDAAIDTRKSQGKLPHPGATECEFESGNGLTLSTNRRSVVASQEWRTAWDARPGGVDTTVEQTSFNLALSETPFLFAEMRERKAQRGARDLNQSAERRVHLQNQEDCASNGQSRNE